MTLLSDQQKDLRARARTLADSRFRDRAARIDETQEYPHDNVRDLVEAGFMGMTLPKSYGGQGLSYLDTVLVVEEIARACAVTARIVVEGNTGGIAAIMAYGTDSQKQRAAAHVLAGDKPAICITEPGAGSAATEMTTTAVRKGENYILNGKKHWITGGGVSRLHLIFARVMEGGVSQGIAGFIAERGKTKGLSVGAREPTMGLRGIPETEIILQDAEIPADGIIVPPGGLARGFAGLMTAYNSQRVGAGTVALGIAQGAYELALQHLKSRHQFGRPLAEFQGLQWMLADMSIALEASRALLWNAAAGAGDGVGGGFPDLRAAAQAKIMASETAVKVTNDALQLHGAAGYSRNNPLERMVRDARMFTIGGGTAQVLRTQVAGSILGIKTPQTRDGYAVRNTIAAE